MYIGVRRLILNIEPPVSSIDFNIPFDSPKFDEDDFENLCADLFEQEFGIGFHRYGTKGNAQYGIDLISDIGADGYYLAVQCKHVKKFSSSEVDKEINKFESMPLPIKKIYFVATCPINSNTVNHCHQKADLIDEPLESIETWDRNYICRKIKKYPDIVGTYFGLQWRDHLFPNLNENNQRKREEELTTELKNMKKRYSLLHAKFTENTQIYNGAEIEIKPISNGYLRDKHDVIKFYGDVASNRGFCLKYSVSFNVDDVKSARTMFSIILSPEDAVDLEAVLLMDMKQQASKSTYYSHDVLLTHIDGPTPMISFPSKDMTLMLARNSDYHKLLECVEKYLDNYKDVALSARRYRTIKDIDGKIPKLNSLFFQMKII